MKKETQKKLFAPSHMTENEYRNNPAVNKSTLWAMNKSPMHYQHILNNPPQDTQALKIGRAVHDAVLLPDDFEKKYVAAPNVDRRTKDGKEAYSDFLAGAGDREILSMADYQEVKLISAAVWNCRESEELLTGCTMEKPLFWTNAEDGIDCKCRVDAMKPGIMIDLKTTADASTEAFTREVFRYGYDVQAAHYIDAYHSICGEYPTWYFIAVEKSEPYVVNVIQVDTGVIDYGFCRRDDLLKRLADCRKTGQFDGYGKNILVLPSYMEV